MGKNEGLSCAEITGLCSRSSNQSGGAAVSLESGDHRPTVNAPSSLQHAVWSQRVDDSARSPNKETTFSVNSLFVLHVFTFSIVSLEIKHIKHTLKIYHTFYISDQFLKRTSCCKDSPGTNMVECETNKYGSLFTITDPRGAWRRLKRMSGAVGRSVSHMMTTAEIYKL